MSGDEEVAGWRVAVTYVERGETRTETSEFMSPIRVVAERNVRSDFRRWHPRAAILAVEGVSPILAGRGWGDAPLWKKAFT